MGAGSTVFAMLFTKSLIASAVNNTTFLDSFTLSILFSLAHLNNVLFVICSLAAASSGFNNCFPCIHHSLLDINCYRETVPAENRGYAPSATSSNGRITSNLLLVSISFIVIGLKDCLSTEPGPKTVFSEPFKALSLVVDPNRFNVTVGCKPIFATTIDIAPDLKIEPFPPGFFQRCSATCFGFRRGLSMICCVVRHSNILNFWATSIHSNANYLNTKPFNPTFRKHTLNPV
jgi:hypothetical protein